MSYADNPYRSSYGDFAANAAVDERADFIRKTYAHLLGAVFAFAAIEAVLLNTVAKAYTDAVMSAGSYAPLFLIGGMMLVSYVANKWAMSSTSSAMQYAGLSLYVAMEAVIFMPILYIADKYFQGQHLILTAGAITGIVFGGLTAIVFVTGANFNWMRNVLFVAGLGAMGAVLCSVFMGFSLGIWFSAAMIVFACGWILYDTSNVMHNYRVGQHVAAALALFASVMILFFYILQFLMQLTSRD